MEMPLSVPVILVAFLLLAAINVVVAESSGSGGDDDFNEVVIKVCYSPGHPQCDANCTIYRAPLDEHQCFNATVLKASYKFGCVKHPKCFDVDFWETSNNCQGQPQLEQRMVCDQCFDRHITRCNATATMSYLCDDDNCNHCPYLRQEADLGVCTPASHLPPGQKASMKVHSNYTACASVEVTRFREFNCPNGRGQSIQYEMPSGVCSDYVGDYAVSYTCKSKHELTSFTGKVLDLKEIPQAVYDRIFR